MNEPAPPTEADLKWLRAHKDSADSAPIDHALTCAVLYLLHRDQRADAIQRSVDDYHMDLTQQVEALQGNVGAAGGEGEEAAHMVERLLADALERERTAHQALRTGVQQEIRQYERSTAMPGRGRYNIVAGLARLLDPPDPE